MGEGMNLDVFYGRIVNAARVMVPAWEAGGDALVDAEAELVAAVIDLGAVEAAYERAEASLRPKIQTIPSFL
jgi:hypothetical protein